MVYGRSTHEKMLTPIQVTIARRLVAVCGFPKAALGAASGASGASGQDPVVI
jgi:hypothetical protein